MAVAGEEDGVGDGVCVEVREGAVAVCGVALRLWDVSDASSQSFLITSIPKKGGGLRVEELTSH
jgi:hypothetical protein